MYLSEEVLTSFAKFSELSLKHLPPKTHYSPSSKIIDFTKSTMMMFCILLMVMTRNYSLRAVFYSAIHGTYGLIWFMKSQYFFPDPGFSEPISLGSQILTGVALGNYYLIPIATMFGKYPYDIERGRVFVVIVLFIMGSFLMVGADCQKYFTLQHKKGLISTGFFSKTRNPNYLGEMMIYYGFVLICNQTWVYVLITAQFCFLFFVRNANKELSLFKKEGAKSYFEQSNVLIPKIY